MFNGNLQRSDMTWILSTVYLYSIRELSEALFVSRERGVKIVFFFFLSYTTLIPASLGSVGRELASKKGKSCWNFRILTLTFSGDTLPCHVCHSHTSLSSLNPEEMVRAIEPGISLSPLLLSVVAQSCATLWNPMDCSLPGSSVHGILQARMLEWIAVPFYRGSPQHKDWSQVSCIAGGFVTIWATREA